MDPEVSCKAPASFEASDSLQAGGRVAVFYLQQNEGSNNGCLESSREFGDSRFSSVSTRSPHSKPQSHTHS